MAQSIREILQNFPRSGQGSAGGISRPVPHDLPGDPACPHCHGVGWLYDPTIPPGDPRFGKLQPCVCMEPHIREKQSAAAFRGVEDLAGLTFENFNPRGSRAWPPSVQDVTERAYRLARQYALQPEGWLVLQGNYGSGKTHLAAAIANAAVERGIRTVIITVPNLLDALRAGYQDNTYLARLDELRNVPLLILDDFGTQNATPWAREKLFQIVNDRYIKRLPLVVTTNQELPQIEPRIRSRLRDTSLTTFIGMPNADYRNGTVSTAVADAAGVIPWESLRHFSLGNFHERSDLPPVPRRRLADAWRTCQQYAASPRGNLIIVGDPTTGKTHLAAGIALEFAQRQPNGALYVSVPDLLDHLRSTFAPDVQHPYTKVFENVRSVPLLALDDFGMQNSTPWSQEKMFQIINHRYLYGLSTVVVFSDQGTRHSQRIVHRIKANAVTVDLRKIPPFSGGRR